jgi:predicted enzyme related to lactoylglutathione lyase
LAGASAEGRYLDGSFDDRGCASSTRFGSADKGDIGRNQNGDHMSERERYSAGVPCWVETLQPNPRAALDFYGALFEWEFAGPGPMPGDQPGQYFVARVRGRDVAGIGSLPLGSGLPAPAWTTYIRVDSVDESAARANKAGGGILHGPLDVPPAGRLAILSDPAGGIVGAWEARARQGAELVNEPRAWALSLLRSTDPERSIAFYGAVFGWQPEPFGPAGSQITLWRLPGYEGGEPHQPVPRDVVGVMTEISGDGPPRKPRSHWDIDFWIDDVDAAAADAARLGGRVIEPPVDTPGFRSAVLADSQGASFSVSQRTAAP